MTVQEMDRAIVTQCVEELLEQGFNLSLFHEEALAFKHSTNKEQILSNLLQCDEETLAIYDNTQQRVGWVFFVYGNDGYDVISDYSITIEQYIPKTQELVDKLQVQSSAEWEPPCHE